MIFLAPYVMYGIMVEMWFNLWVAQWNLLSGT